jgi:hypothetical protein
MALSCGRRCRLVRCGRTLRHRRRLRSCGSGTLLRGSARRRRGHCSGAVAGRRLRRRSFGGGRSSAPRRGRRNGLERWNRFSGHLRLGRRFRGRGGGRRCSFRRCGGWRSGDFRFRFCGRRGLQQHAAHEIRDVIWNDAQLVLRLEDPAQSLVKEGDQLFRSEPDLFCKFKYPNFSGSQILPFTLQAYASLGLDEPEGACIYPQVIENAPPPRADAPGVLSIALVQHVSFNFKIKPLA